MKAHPVAKVGEIPPGGRKPVTIGKIQFGVFNVDGRFFAIQDSCPHEEGSLGEGTLCGSVVTCPVHAYEFLARRGWHATLVDAASGPAQAASALPVGMLSPHVTRAPTPLSRLSALGVADMRDQLEQRVPPGAGWQTAVSARCHSPRYNRNRRSCICHHRRGTNCLSAAAETRHHHQCR